MMTDKTSIYVVLLFSASLLNAHADSLFTPAVAKSGTLISQKVARFAPGDLITVQVRERIDASTTSDLNTRKESKLQNKANAADNTLLVSPNGLDLLDPEQLPNYKTDAKNEHRTTGRTRRQTMLSTEVACAVREVYPNGTLLIEGQKKVALNREDSVLFVQGIIRAKDVSPANTIESTKVANLIVELRGRGPLWNNQRRGIVSRFLDWVSPF